MQVFAKFEMYNTITGEAEVLRIRRIVSEHMQSLAGSNKVVSQGIFADARGGFFIFSLESADDLWSLLTPILDHFQVETHLILSSEKLKELV